MSAPDCLKARLTARIGRLAVDLELDTSPGTLVLIGPNGAGKSSLLDLLLGVRQVDEGHIHVGGDVLLDTASGVALPVEERRIGYVPQDYALFPHLSVRANIDFALAARGESPDRALAERVDAVLRDLHLEGYGDRRIHALSGGEKQRVALARALSVRPRALLLDEPLAALDVHARREVREFLAGYLEDLSLPTIVVTHDAADARMLSHRIAVLEAGKLTQTGTWDQLATAPASRFVEEFTTGAWD